MEELRKKLISCRQQDKKLEACITIGKYFTISLKERKELCDMYWECAGDTFADDIIISLKANAELKKEETWDDIDKRWGESDMVNPTQDNVFEWLKLNYNVPTKK